MKIHAINMPDPGGYDVFDLVTGEAIMMVIEIDSDVGTLRRAAMTSAGHFIHSADGTLLETTEHRQFCVVARDGREVCRTSGSIMDHLRF